MTKVSKKSKRRLLFFGTISICAIIYCLVTLIGYIYNYSSLKIEEKKLNDSLSALQEQKKNLKIEIVKLNDPSYVARYAKENYLYSSDGEYVIKIDNDDNVTEESSKTSYVLIYILSGATLVIILLLIKKKKSVKN